MTRLWWCKRGYGTDGSYLEKEDEASIFWYWKHYALGLITLPYWTSELLDMFCFQHWFYCFHISCFSHICFSAVKTIQNCPILGLLLIMKSLNWSTLVCHANQYMCLPLIFFNVLSQGWNQSLHCCLTIQQWIGKQASF